MNLSSRPASLSFAAALGAAVLFVSPCVGAATSDAGAFDFGEFVVPTGGGEFVEVDISRNLIAIASRLVGRDEPDVAAVLAGLHNVRVNVIGIDDGNRADLTARVARARADLTRQGWDRVVTFREQREAVDVYVKTRGDEFIDGIVVTVLDEKEHAVFVNIVGNIKPEQIAMLGERFGVEPLKEIGVHTRGATGG